MFDQVVAPRTEKLLYCQRVLENELLTITASELQQLRKACTRLKAGEGDAKDVESLLDRCIELRLSMVRVAVKAQHLDSPYPISAYPLSNTPQMEASYV